MLTHLLRKCGIAFLPVASSRMETGLRMLLRAVVPSCLSAVVAVPAWAWEGEEAERTASPYFFVLDADTGVDAFPLKATDVDVRIAGVIAEVTIVQTYRNEGERALEARYVFPGSTRAAVHAMTVRLGERLIEARIREKRQAREEYEQAKSTGRTTALLEQHRPNVFQMNVANILPGDDVQVELHYTELLVPEDGRYQFVFPAVVGPRYAGPQSASADDGWVAHPVLPEGQERDSPSKFNIGVRLDTPIGIKELRSPSHDIALASPSPHSARVKLGADDGADGLDAGNRDFILDYRLAGDRIESGVMMMRARGDEAENFFLAMIEPPRAVPSSRIVPREYIFVVDVSGSMKGFPLATAKTLLRELIGSLRPGDSFNVLLFESSSRFLHETSVPATVWNISRSLRLIDAEGGGNGTELIPALRKVYAQPVQEGVSRTIVVVTDGYVVVESDAFQLVRRNLGQANLFAFGIGSSVNRHLIEGMARAGMGEPFVIVDPAEAKAQAERFRRMISSPVLTRVQARFEGIETYDVVPQALPDVLVERPVIMFGKWREMPLTSGAPSSRLTIEGWNAQGPYREVLPLFEAADDFRERFLVLRRLWARHRIAELSDQENLAAGAHISDIELLRREITRLGLEYGLLTKYTSFIAVDQQVRTADGDLVAVSQPLPLPKGVSAAAVGGSHVPSSPEPRTLGALLVTLSMLAMLARWRQRRRQRWTS
jgi:Ca-activated chloride channel family protein